MLGLKRLKTLVLDGVRDLRRLAQLRKLQGMRRAYEDAVEQARSERKEPSFDLRYPRPPGGGKPPFEG